MDASNITKEDINKMSDAEVKFWFQKFAADEQADQMRKHMLDQTEIRDAAGPRTIPIHVDSTEVK